jgi:hypothetical protein
MGSVKSKAKAKTARANGAKGGRPRKLPGAVKRRSAREKAVAPPASAREANPEKEIKPQITRAA